MLQRKLEQNQYVSYLAPYGSVGLHQGNRGTRERTPQTIQLGHEIELQVSLEAFTFSCVNVF